MSTAAAPLRPTHAIGSYILDELDLPDHAKAMARHHHERWDGGGYPDGLAGEAIPPAARVLTVADAIDAMTTDRPYRKALPVGRARRDRGEGRHAVVPESGRRRPRGPALTT